MAQLSKTTVTRPDSSLVDYTKAEIQKTKNYINNLLKDKVPGLADKDSVAKLRSGLDALIADLDAISMKSVQDAPDISLRPSAAHRIWPTVHHIRSTSEVSDALRSILQETAHGGASIDKPNLFLDIEGDEITEGLSTVQLFVPPVNQVYIFDLLALGQDAFTTPATLQPFEGWTFERVLEDKNIRKAFYGCSGDSNLLYKHHGICVANVTDLGYMAIAGIGRKDFTRSLGLEQMVGDRCKGFFTEADRKAFKERKTWGKEVFNTTSAKVAELKEAGQLHSSGYIPLFNQRPMPADVEAYCVWDVFAMPMVYEKLTEVIAQLEEKYPGVNVMQHIELKTKKALGESQQDDYGEDNYKAGAPEWAGLWAPLH